MKRCIMAGLLTHPFTRPSHQLFDSGTSRPIRVDLQLRVQYPDCTDFPIIGPSFEPLCSDEHHNTEAKVRKFRISLLIIALPVQKK